ncbi:hypothetical protein F7018_10405 [Tenacibaculum aiptasiae]|uniref:Bacteriophage CI repressor n=1 Tax=Tenacibaculum aiptasiae TaxID=426481 RepID=A0A7J5AI88_9FLAO|nr:hypothetical protein [Tenacibaculum aiptasiae]KAB1157332.1 hypothetical protein F7018_10405 [Tenacibaculum aiptasiae]
MEDFIDETYKRVEQIINYKRFNIRSFEEEINVSNNSIGTAIRRKSSFKSNVLNKILHSFPEIDPTWLLTGRGEMLLNNKEEYIASEPSSLYEPEVIANQVKESLLKLLLEDGEVKKALITQIEQGLKK